MAESEQAVKSLVENSLKNAPAGSDAAVAVFKTGQALSQRRALLRYVLSWVWFLPPLLLTLSFGLHPGQVGLLTVIWVIVWALLSRFQAQKQFWHDVWAGTRLVTYR
jgi:hypothetical protein